MVWKGKWVKMSVRKLLQDCSQEPPMAWTRWWLSGRRGASSWGQTSGVWISPTHTSHCTSLPGLNLPVSWSWWMCSWSAKLLFCRKYYYVFNSLWLTLRIFLGGYCRRRCETKITLYNNSILPVSNLDLWCVRGFPRTASLDEQIFDIQDSFRTSPTLCISSDVRKLPCLFSSK